MQPFNSLESPTGVAPELTINLNDGSSEQVSIIIVHHEKPAYLNICMQSIAVCSHLNQYEVIVVDNGSTQETQEYLDILEQEGIKVIRNKTNKHWSAACNQGVAMADPRSNYYIFMHADTVVINPAWIDVMINMAEHKGSGLVGTAIGEYYLEKKKIQFIQEWCLLMSKQCWKDCGPWPEELTVVGHSFIMTLRAQYKGYKPISSGNNIVQHYKAFSMDVSEYEKLAEQGKALLPKLMQAAQS